MGYFDPAYFSPTYFDTGGAAAAVGVTSKGPPLGAAVVSGPRRRVHHSVPQRRILTLDDPEDLWLLDLEDLV